MEIAKMDVIIAGDITALQTALNKAKSDLTSFGDGVGNAIQPANAHLNELSDTVVKAGGEMELSARHAIGLGRGLVEVEAGAAEGRINIFGFTEVLRVAGTEFSNIRKETGSTAAAFQGLAQSLVAPETAIFVIVTALAALTSEAQKTDIELSKSEQATKDYTDAFGELNKFIIATKKELGDAPTIIETAQVAFNQLSSTVKSLTESYRDLSAVQKELLTKLLPALAEASIQLAQAQLEEQQKLNIGLNQLADERLQHDLEIQKANNSAILSDTQNSYAQRFAALKNILSEEKKINQAAYDSELQASAGNILKIQQAEETLRFENLKAEQSYNKDYLKLEQKQTDDLNKELEQRIADERALFEDFNKTRRKFFQNVAAETGNPTAPTDRNLNRGPQLLFPDQNKADQAIANQEKLNKVLAISDELSQALAQTFEQIFVDLITTGKVSFKQLETELVRFIAKLGEAVLQAFLLKTIFAALTGGIGAGLPNPGALSNILSSGIPHFAGGGIVNSPTTALIGESGPEAVIPLDKISQLFGSIGGSNIQISGELRASGTDLVVALNRGNVRINRNYGSNFTN